MECCGKRQRSRVSSCVPSACASGSRRDFLNNPPSEACCVFSGFPLDAARLDHRRFAVRFRLLPRIVLGQGALYLPFEKVGDARRSA